MRFVRLVVVAAVLLAACGGSSDTTTTAADGATTTAAPGDEGDGEGEGPSIDIGDIPQECLDALGDMLRAIEPAVEGVDFDNATTADLEALDEDLSAATAEFENTDCDELNVEASDEETFDFMIDFAQDEAPGTVAYLEWVRDLAADFGSGESAATGDCEQDIAAVMEFVDRDGGMGDLTVAELTTVGQLMASVATACSAERYQEFVTDPEITEFLESA